jgi:hypothetical protein
VSDAAGDSVEQAVMGERFFKVEWLVQFVNSNEEFI